MGEVKSFHDLGVWQKGMDIAVVVYKLAEGLPKSETYGLGSQMRRAAVSIPSNIAEGHGRRHRKEYLHFVSIALGSLAELETQILLGERLGYFSSDQSNSVIERIREVGRMLQGLIRALQPST